MANGLQSTCSLVLIISSVILVNNFVQSYNEVSEDDVPLSKLSQNAGAPTLKFLYCYSCGYRKAFSEYVSIIQQKYPYLLIEGDNYQPSGLNMLISRIIGIAKVLFIISVFLRINIFNYINQPEPSWWIWFNENRMYSCLMLILVCNIIEGQLVQSGAFEISLNDVPVWSKLDTGRIPQPAELFQIIDNLMRFSESNTVDLNNNNFAK